MKKAPSPTEFSTYSDISMVRHTYQFAVLKACSLFSSCCSCVYFVLMIYLLCQPHSFSHWSILCVCVRARTSAWNSLMHKPFCLKPFARYLHIHIPTVLLSISSSAYMFKAQKNHPQNIYRCIEYNKWAQFCRNTKPFHRIATRNNINCFAQQTTQLCNIIYRS